MSVKQTRFFTVNCAEKLESPNQCRCIWRTYLAPDDFFDLETTHPDNNPEGPAPYRHLAVNGCLFCLLLPSAREKSRKTAAL
jgi:hypothetical protein